MMMMMMEKASSVYPTACNYHSYPYPWWPGPYLD